MNEDREKFKLKRVHILAIILAALLLYLGLGMANFERKNAQMKERVASGEFDDYHNQPNNPFGAPVVYYRSDIERIVGVRLAEKKMKIDGYDCKEYRNSGKQKTRYDKLRFYIFDKESHAQKVFESIREKSFYRITDEGNNYVRGWLDGVVDADIEQYYYINGNLIVTAVVTSVDESARAVDDPTPSVYGGGEEAIALIRLINEHF